MNSDLVLGVIMLVGPPIYFGYRVYKQGYIKAFLQGSLYGLLGLAWAAAALWLILYN